MNLTIRMYNTGFGDCFLLMIPTADRTRKVLIDCGKHMLSRSGPPLEEIVDQLLVDITENGESRVDVLVATHRHQDHVSGFGDSRWHDVQVGEVWMPWTEDPEDPVARDICDRQSARAAQAHRALNLLGLKRAQKDYLLQYAGNSLKNAAAMNLLHGGFQGEPGRRFLPLSDPRERVIHTDALPSVEVHVLGPPRDPQVMREMDPPESESFLRACLAIESPGAGAAELGTGDEFMLTRAGYVEAARKGCGARLSMDPLEGFSEDDETGLSKALEEPAMELLARLEQAVNSTSLVLLFHVGSARLLFAADAQWGTWNAMLNDPLQAKLLEDVTFYKVGHHGSHNATPMSFVERYVGSQAKVMLPYGKVERWPSIPRAGLLQALEQKGVVVLRPDQAPPAGVAHRMKGADVLSIDLELPFGPSTPSAGTSRTTPTGMRVHRSEGRR